MPELMCDDDLRLLGPDQMETVLRKLDDKLHDAEDRLKTQQAMYDSLTDRSRYQTEGAWQASFEEHKPLLTEAEDNLAETARAVADVTSRIMGLAGTNVPPTMTGAEMAQAGSIASLIREDVAELPLAELRDAMRTALVNKDRPALFLFLRYLDRGVRQFLPETEVEGRLVQEIGELQQKMRADLADPRLAAVRERAEATNKAAFEAGKRSLEQLVADKRSDPMYNSL